LLLFPREHGGARNPKRCVQLPWIPAFAREQQVRVPASANATTPVKAGAQLERWL